MHATPPRTTFVSPAGFAVRKISSGTLIALSVTVLGDLPRSSERGSPVGHRCNSQSWAHPQSPAETGPVARSSSRQLTFTAQSRTSIFLKASPTRAPWSNADLSPCVPRAPPDPSSPESERTRTECRCYIFPGAKSNWTDF